MIRSREERKTINEQCLWCLDDHRVVNFGTIVNESASGLLLQTVEPLKLGDELYLLTPCFGEPLSPDNLSAKQLMQYPVTRKGKVVRLATLNEYGIHFEEENKPAEFRRWYRESSTIYTLLTKKVAVIVLEGDINLETSTLTQSLANNFRRQVSDFVFSLENVQSFAGAAGAVIKSVIKSCGSGGWIATVIYGSHYEKAKQLVDELKGDGIFSFNTSDIYQTKPSPYSKSSEKETNTTSLYPAEKVDSNPNKDVRFLVVAPKVSMQKNLSRFIGEQGGKVIAVSLMHEALNKILEYEHHYVVLDIDLEEVNILLMLNQLIAKNLSHFPELIILGPKHIGELVKAALKLPVHTYLSKPYLDRDYHFAIETIMFERNKHEN